MTTFKVGDEVEVTRDTYNFPKGTRGVVTRESYGSRGGGNIHIEANGEEGIVLGEDAKLVRPTKNQRITALENTVKELQAQIDELKQPKEVNLSTLAAEAIDRQIKQDLLTNNQKRAAIIEKAKKFVEEYKHRMGFTAGHPYVKFNRVFTEVKFIVNSEKRTVVALVSPKYKHDGNRILAKGIAKCAPTDVFNEHIGKAIALGRALGLDVSEFEQAEQPDEVVVGMIFDTNWGEGFQSQKCYQVKGDYIYNYENKAGWFTKDHIERITNDTDAVY